MRIRLVTFADGSFGLRAAGRRLVKQADASGWFSNPSEHWTLDTLRDKLPNFFAENEVFIKNHPKGLGLWVWKPAILSYLIENLDDDEMVLFLDSGCQINSTHESRIRFNEYLEKCQERELLLMQLNNESFGFKNTTEIAWTKSTALDLLDPFSVHRNSNQIQSGIIFAVKSEKSKRVASKWLDLCLASNHSLLIDPDDGEVQTSDFIQHRWEQSILSLILKSEGIVPILDETYFYPEWQKGLGFPIWTMRNRSGGDAFRRNVLDMILIVIARIERTLMKLYRNLL